MRRVIPLIIFSVLALSSLASMSRVYAAQDGPARSMDSGNFDAPNAPLSGSAQKAIKGAYGKEISSETALSKIIGNIVRGVLVLLGTIFLVLVVFAGYKWMTAAGNEEEVTKAKSIITEATIGLIVIMAAWIITNFVLASLEKATI